MKNADHFEEIDVAMDIVKYTGRDSDNGKFLILRKAKEYRENRERYNPEKGGTPWEIPGGKFEIEKETSYTDLEKMQEGLRELHEETQIYGIPLKTGEQYPDIQEDVQINFYPVYFEYSGEPDSIELDPDEHDRYEWVTREEFMDRMTENEIEALEQVTHQ